MSVAHNFPLVAYSPLLRGFYADMARPLPKEFDNAYNLKRMAALAKVAGKSAASPRASWSSRG